MRFFLFLFLLGYALVNAGEITITHSTFNIEIETQGTYQQINYRGVLNGSALKEDWGNPDLPFYLKTIVLEPGTEIDTFTIANVQTLHLQGTFLIAPKQPAWSSERDMQYVPANPQVYHQAAPFPSQVVEYLGTQIFNGQSIAHFAIYPFQYLPAQKQLLFVEQVQIQFRTKPLTRPSVQPAVESDQQVVNRLLAPSNNSQILQKFNLPPSTDQIDPQWLSSGLIDRYVIITTQELASAFTPLQEWKIQRGVPTVVRTLSWIRQNFPDGIDDAERIRNFIRWSYSKRGTRYVLLAGDTEIIPTRIIHTGNYTFATDYYFADLDGTWNADQDDTFGEVKDQLEGYPEVYVGRLPVLSTDDVQLLVRKILEYEKFQNIDSEHFPTNILYLAGDLQRENDSRDQLILKHIDPVIPPYFERTMISQSEHTGNSPEVPLRELNKSYGLIFSEGHGLYFIYRPGGRGSELFNYHLNELTTPDPGIWYMASCYTNDITKRCFGEDYLLSPNGGGLAYIGNSSWEYPFSGIALEKEFFNLVFNKGFYHLSEAHYLSRLPYLGYLNFEGTSRIIVYSTIVLGDPELPIWTNKVKHFLVQDSLITSSSNRYLQVVVQKDDSTKSAVNGATVVLYKKDQLYKIVKSDAQGLANIDLNGVVLDSVTLTVWARNFRPYQKIVNLSEGETFAFEIKQAHFEQMYGNSNNQCEPGETFLMHLQLKNSGQNAWLSNTKIYLTERTNLCQFSDSLIFLNTVVNPGDTTALPAIEMQVNRGLVSDTTVYLQISVEPVRGKKMVTDFPFNIFTPQIRVSSQLLVTLAGTDSEGFNTSFLTLNFFNEGQGKAWQITARLNENDSLVHLENNSIYLPELAPMTFSSNDEYFVIKHKTPLSNVHFRLQIEEASGKRWEQFLDIVPPQKVESPVFRPATDGGILLTWTAPQDSDLYGYLIFRANGDGSPDTFKLITPQPVLNAGYFVDDQVIAGQHYLYTIQAVDSSGNYGPFSDTLRTWSALPFQSGFPVRPGVKAIGSEISGVTSFDLDGNGFKELIVAGGNGQLYVYTHKGELLFKTDSLQGNLMFPAVGQVTGDLQPEIVVAGYAEGVAKNNLYVIDSRNGNVLAHKFLRYNAPSPAVLADLDHDGFDEILVLTHANNAPESPHNARVFIFTDSSGQLISFKDWPEEGYLLSGTASVGNLAVADLDQSGMLSVLVPTVESKLYCFKPDSAAQPKWVKSFPNPLEAPISVADLNGDGFIEIIVPVVKSDLLFALNYDGSELPGWENGLPCKVTNPYWRVSPAIVGNVDADPELEIIYVGREEVYVFNFDGTLLNGFPVPIENGDNYFDNGWEVLPPYNAPVLADVNQDGAQEIIFLNAFGYINALNVATGQQIAGFPLFIKNNFIKGHSPTIDDIDADGDLEVLVVNHEGVLLVWDAPQKYNEQTEIPWSQPFANAQHTGLYTPLKVQLISEVVESYSSLPQRFELLPNFPNPFNPQTTIAFELKKTAQVQLVIYNVLGQKIIELSNNRLFSAGRHTLVWNGKNQAGAEVASGLYFYRFTVREPTSGKILFNKIHKMIKLK